MGTAGHTARFRDVGVAAQYSAALATSWRVQQLARSGTGVRWRRPTRTTGDRRPRALYRTPGTGAGQHLAARDLAVYERCTWKRPRSGQLARSSAAATEPHATRRSWQSVRAVRSVVFKLYRPRLAGSRGDRSSAGARADRDARPQPEVNILTLPSVHVPAGLGIPGGTLSAEMVNDPGRRRSSTSASNRQLSRTSAAA